MFFGHKYNIIRTFSAVFIAFLYVFLGYRYPGPLITATIAKTVFFYFVGVKHIRTKFKTNTFSVKHTCSPCVRISYASY